MPTTREFPHAAFGSRIGRFLWMLATPSRPGRLLLILLVCLWPSLASGQTQSARTTDRDVYKKALSSSRQEAQEKAQPTSRPSAKIPPFMVEAVFYEGNGVDGIVLQLVKTDTQWYGLTCGFEEPAKCGWLQPGVLYEAEIKGKYMYVTTPKNGNNQKPQRIKFEISHMQLR